jgi:hypothetical protein
VLPFSQGILILTESGSQENECKVGFLVWSILQELLLEALPLSFLVSRSATLLIDFQTGVSERYAVPLAMPFVDEESMPSENHPKTKDG